MEGLASKLDDRENGFEEEELPGLRMRSALQRAHCRERTAVGVGGGGIVNTESKGVTKVLKLNLGKAEDVQLFAKYVQVVVCRSEQVRNLWAQPRAGPMMR